MISDSNTHINFNQHIRQYLSENIKLADKKAITSIAISAIFIYVLNKSGLFTSPITATIFVSFILAAIFSAIMVIYPQSSKEKKGFVYWGASLNFSLEEYREEIQLLSIEEINNEIATINYNLGIINRRKFIWMKWALRFNILSLLTIIASIVYLIIQNYQ